MRKISVYLLFVCLIFIGNMSVLGDEETPSLAKFGERVESFVPTGWKIIKIAKGDLNKDCVEDIACVIEKKTNSNSNIIESQPRILFIIFKENKGFHLSIQTEKAILKADEGGVFGDPFQSLTVDRGSFLIDFYGGSRDRWAYIYRFRFQNDGWFLIGVTTFSGYAATDIAAEEGITNDYNLLTGIMIKTQTDKNGKKKAKTINRGKKKLVSLKDFDVIEIDSKQF